MKNSTSPFSEATRISLRVDGVLYMSTICPSYNTYQYFVRQKISDEMENGNLQGGMTHDQRHQCEADIKQRVFQIPPKGMLPMGVW